MLELPKDEINFYLLKERNKWNNDELSKFKELMKDKKDFSDLLNTIYDYHLSFNQIGSLNTNQLHKIGLRNFFIEKTESRSIEQLLKEHNEILKKKEIQIPSNEEDLNIIKRINNIKNLSIKYLGKKISKNSIDKEFKNKIDDLIAIVYNEVKEIKKFELNDSQLYSLITLLNKKRR